MVKNKTTERPARAEVFILKTPAQTIKFGKALGRLLAPGNVVALIGELGAGKTTLTKGLSLGLGVKNASEVVSPTFVLIREYQGRIPVYHFDLYRLKGMEDVELLGCREYFYGQGVTVIEWADKITPFLPEQYLAIKLSFADEKDPGSAGRKIELIAHGREYRLMLAQLDGIK